MLTSIGHVRRIGLVTIETTMMARNQRAGRTTVAVIGCLAIVLSASSGASAQEACPPEDRVKAVALVKQGLARMDGRQYDLAAEDFRSAYALCPEAQVRKFLGRACEAAGRLDEAAVAYEACSREAATDSLRRECESAIQSVRERMREGVLLVEADPRDAVVYLDGAAAGHETGQPIPVRSGRHSIEVRAAGTCRSCRSWT